MQSKRFNVFSARQYAALLTLLFCVVSASAQDARPPAGQDVDVSRTVDLLQRVPFPCVAVAFEGDTVLLPRADLERVAQAAPPAWKTEQERVALVASKRAQEFLLALGETAPSHGCTTLKSPLTQEGQSLILSYLEAGKAAILSAPAGVLQPAVVIRYWGERAGPLVGRGVIMVRLPVHENPFLIVSWWVS